MVYTHASGACGSNPVGVRVSPKAHFDSSASGGLARCKPEIMKIEIKGVQGNPVNVLRRAGYAFQRAEGNEMSFVRPLASAGYPRFHMYAEVIGFDLRISIHLDQKKETYGEATRHHGEYENEGALKVEADRIKEIICDE